MRVNEVIFYVLNIEMDVIERDNIFGEGYFICVFNYFNLLNSWLNVLLIMLFIIEIEEFNLINQVLFVDVWVQIEFDLENVV